MFRIDTEALRSGEAVEQTSDGATREVWGKVGLEAEDSFLIGHRLSPV